MLVVQSVDTQGDETCIGDLSSISNKKSVTVRVPAVMLYIAKIETSLSLSKTSHLGDRVNHTKHMSVISSCCAPLDAEGSDVGSS